MRSAGILLPVFSLHNDYGIGSFGRCAYEFVDFLKASGMHSWQVLPLGPTGFGNSPYQSSSSHAGNPLFIDLELLEKDGVLTKEELELLPFSSIIITSEDGIRFLADYLNGDTYYNVFYPTQNLDRSRTQLKLVEDMERKEVKIRTILKKIYTELHLDADPFRIKW